MTAPARHSFDHYAHDDELWPGERISPRRKRGVGKALLRGIVVLLMLGGGWVVLNDQAWREWVLAKIGTAASTLDSWMAAPAEPRMPPVRVVSPPAAPEPAPKLIALEALPPAAPPLTTGSIPPASTPYEAPSSAAPDADLANPYQKRAVEVGLHPGLSRAVLERLSLADFRNAGIAIRTAVAETPDTGVLVWPRQPEPDLALFKVRFVQGAPQGCRRYVVTITKDRWLTTALPMERCGTQAGRPQRG